MTPPSALKTVDYSDPVAHARAIGIKADPLMASYVEHHVRNLLTPLLIGDLNQRNVARHKLDKLFAVLKGEIQ